MTKVKTDTQHAETTLYGLNNDAYKPFQGWQITSETSGSAGCGTAELFSTYIDQSVPEWVAGGFIQAKTTNKDDTNLTLGTTGLAFEFFGGGISETIGSLAPIPDASSTQTGLFPLAWLSAIHEGLQTTWNPNYFDPYLEFAGKVIGREDAVGSLEEALSGKVLQKVREGDSFSWADGYSMVQYKQGFQSVTVGNLDSLQVLDIEQFQSQRQKIAEGLRGGKWPKITVADCLNLTVTDQRYPSSRFEVEIPTGFTTTNGPDEYNPELNFSSRRFGSEWKAVTGNQVVFGMGSGDFNLGPGLQFSHYSKDAQKWEIDITDDMVKKLFSDWEHEFDVVTNASTSAPEYASDLTATVYPTSDNIDSTQLFDEVPDDEWWITRNKLVKMGLDESYEICAPGDYMYSWEKGNKREVLIEDEEGQKRSANYDDGTVNKTYSQRDITLSESKVSGVLHETSDITNLTTTLKTGFNYSVDIAGAIGLSTEEVGFSMGGPLKPSSGEKAQWKGGNYIDPTTWQGQGMTGSMSLQTLDQSLSAEGISIAIKITNPTNMRVTQKWPYTGVKSKAEATAWTNDCKLLLGGYTKVEAGALLGEVWMRGQESKLGFTHVYNHLTTTQAKNLGRMATKGAELAMSACVAYAENQMATYGATATLAAFYLNS